MPLVSRRPLLLVGIIWFAFLLKTLFYASFIPLWEGYDEYSHFAFVQYLAANASLPTAASNSSREVAESLDLAPVPWLLRNAQPGWMTHDDLWKLPADIRRERESRLRSIPPHWAREPATPPLPLYEAQQPPLPYLILWLPYRALEHASLLTRMWALRLTCSFLASLAIPFGFLLARRVFANDSWSLAAIAIAASMPELMITTARVSNEGLAIAIGSACILAFLSISIQPVCKLSSAACFGLSLAAALLTKAYFLAFFGAIAVVFAWMMFRHRKLRDPLLFRFSIVVALPIAVAGWWYLRNFGLTGTVTGLAEDVRSRSSEMSALQAFVAAPWWKIVDFAALSHIWLGGWSFLVLRSWMYHGVELISLAAVAGIGWSILHRLHPGRRVLLVLLLPQFFLWLGLAYNALASFRGHGGMTVGYYAYCFVIAEVICLLIGLRALLPASLERLAIPALVACFTALEFFAVNFVLIPYYTGLTAYTPRGSVPALHVSQLARGGFAEIFQRLAMGKTAFLSPEVLFMLWTLFVISSLGLVAISFQLASRCPSPE